MKTTDGCFPSLLVWSLDHAGSGVGQRGANKDLSSGATLRVRIIALNGSLEAPTGPEASIVVA